MFRLYATIILFLLMTGQAFADTHTAMSCSYDDVNTAYTAATTGDTLIIPSGTCVWTTGLTISKGLKIKGAGTGCPDSCNDATIIRKGANITLFTIELSSLVTSETLADQPRLEIFGLTFDADTYGGYGIYVTHYGDANRYGNFRFHHNKFDSLDRGVYYYGDGWGLIDHNYFYDGEYSVYVGGDAYRTWKRYKGAQDCSSTETPCALNWSDLDMGGNKFLFVEDNVVNVYDTYFAFSSGGGGRTVFRFNTATYTGYDSGDGFTDFHGSTANADSVSGYANNNVLTLTDTETRAVTIPIYQFRSGSHLLFNNSVLQPSGTIGTPEVKIYSIDEELGGGCNPLNYGGNATDGYYQQGIHNGFIWDNTYKAATMFLDIDDDVGCIASGTDYWSDVKDDSTTEQDAYVFGTGTSLPATCTKDKDMYWDTDAGNWNKSQSGDNGILYYCSDTNVWTEWFEPYTYPHPLNDPFYESHILGGTITGGTFQ